jgi:hypothetical protein
LRHQLQKKDPMQTQISTSAAVLVLLALMTAPALAHDETAFPDWSGQWSRVPGGGVPRYDPSKPLGRQEAPLKPEYQAKYEANKREIEANGFGVDNNYRCFPSTMPRTMSGVSYMEFAIARSVTHILFDQMTFAPRRIYTDGRAWPAKHEPTFLGYSIGQWRDTDGDGRYDLLEIETRNIRGPKIWDQTGMPMADDNEAVIKERLSIDKADPGILRNEMTTIDNSLTRPWSVLKRYRRTKEVLWVDHTCTEGNPYVVIENQTYLLSGDGRLMPTRKDQPPPDLQYFNRTPSAPRP